MRVGVLGVVLCLVGVTWAETFGCSSLVVDFPTHEDVVMNNAGDEANKDMIRIMVEAAAGRDYGRNYGLEKEYLSRLEHVDTKDADFIQVPACAWIELLKLALARNPYGLYENMRNKYEALVIQFPSFKHVLYTADLAHDNVIRTDKNQVTFEFHHPHTHTLRDQFITNQEKLEMLEYLRTQHHVDYDRERFDLLNDKDIEKSITTHNFTTDTFIVAVYVSMKDKEIRIVTITKKTIIRQVPSYEIKLRDSNNEEEFHSFEIRNENRKQITSHFSNYYHGSHKRSKSPGTGISEVKIMSYNIWNWNADWDRRKEEIISVILDEQPDVIGFQEIRQMLHSDEPNQLMQIFSDSRIKKVYQNALYHPAMVYNTDEEGIGIMTSLPVVSKKFIPMTKVKNSHDGNKRGIYHALLAEPKQQNWLDFFVTHWTYSKGAGQESNSKQSLDFMDKFYGTKHKGERAPQVIVGDFNIYPDDTSAIDSLTNNGKMRDAWVSLHGDELGYTFSNLPSSDLHDRADRIIIRGQHIKESTIKRIGWARDFDNYPPSDHLGLVLEAKIANSINCTLVTAPPSKRAPKVINCS